MAKLQNYTASVPLQSGLKAYDTIGDIPLMEAHSILVDEEGTRLDSKLNSVNASVASLINRVTDLENNGGGTASVSVYQRKITLEIIYINDRSGAYDYDNMPQCTIDINILCSHNNPISTANQTYEKHADIIDFCKNKVKLTPMEVVVTYKDVLWAGVIQTITVVRDDYGGLKRISMSIQVEDGTIQNVNLPAWQDSMYYMAGRISENTYSI